MRAFIFLLPILCLANARELHRFNEDREASVNEDLDSVTDVRESISNQMRHRRKPRQSFYDFPPYYYDYRRDYVRHQDETLNQIVKLLDEISLNLKRPPSPPPQPQIIYVPYPVPYPMPQYRLCVKKQNKVNLTVKWPEMEDDNMNWGLVPGERDDTDDDNDSLRPVSFEPIEPEESVPDPPPVEHGSQQAGMDNTTRAPALKPGRCHAAIIVCCNTGTKRDQYDCFSRYGCPKTFSTGFSCKPDIIKKVLDEYTKAYAPNNKR